MYFRDNFIILYVIIIVYVYVLVLYTVLNNIHKEQIYIKRMCVEWCVIVLDKDSTVSSFCTDGKVRKSIVVYFFPNKNIYVMFSYWILLAVPSVRILSTFHERSLKIL